MRLTKQRRQLKWTKQLAAHPNEVVTNESTNEATAIVRKVVVMEKDGNVINTTETIEEQPIKKA